MKQLFIAVTALFIFIAASAQKDPEFPKGWVMYLESHHGVATRFDASPDIFAGGLSLSPQLTIVPGLLRLGGTVGGIFFNKKIDGTIGPNLVLKLATVNVNQFGSVLNVQLQLEQLWGTNQQKLVGAWLHTEVGQLLVIGPALHRDYGLNYWWFQGGLGYNLLRKKKKGLEDPLTN